MQPNGIGTVLFVCTANRCRSPLAAATLAHHARTAGLRWETSSAGVRVRRGELTETAVIDVLAESGIVEQAHPVRKLEDAIAAGADLVLTAQRSHRSRVLETHPEYVGRVFTMLEFERLLSAAPHRATGVVRTPVELAVAAEAARSRAGVGGGEDDLADPIGQPVSSFRDCQRTVQRVVGSIVAAATR